MKNVRQWLADYKCYFNHQADVLPFLIYITDQLVLSDSTAAPPFRIVNESLIGIKFEQEGTGIARMLAAGYSCPFAWDVICEEPRLVVSPTSASSDRVRFDLQRIHSSESFRYIYIYLWFHKSVSTNIFVLFYKQGLIEWWKSKWQKHFHLFQISQSCFSLWYVGVSSLFSIFFWYSEILGHIKNGHVRFLCLLFYILKNRSIWFLISQWVKFPCFWSLFCGGKAPCYRDWIQGCNFGYLC